MSSNTPQEPLKNVFWQAPKWRSQDPTAQIREGITSHPITIYGNVHKPQESITIMSGSIKYLPSMYTVYL